MNDLTPIAASAHIKAIRTHRPHLTRRETKLRAGRPTHALARLKPSSVESLHGRKAGGRGQIASSTDGRGIARPHRPFVHFFDSRNLDSKGPEWTQESTSSIRSQYQ